MGAGTLIGNDVCNAEYEALGTVTEIMLDMRSGEVAYAVISFVVFWAWVRNFSPCLGVRWRGIPRTKRFVLDVDKERFENAPGFDPNDWPDMANQEWEKSLRDYYAPRP